MDYPRDTEEKSYLIAVINQTSKSPTKVKLNSQANSILQQIGNWSMEAS